MAGGVSGRRLGPFALAVCVFGLAPWRACGQDAAAGGNASNGSSGSGDGNGTAEEVCQPHCCSNTIRHEANLACREFDNFGLSGAGACPFWEDYAAEACLLHCGNCTEIAKAIYSQCVFFLNGIIPIDMAMMYCSGAREAFEIGRCPSACIEKNVHCFTNTSRDCNALCGNWHQGCDCVKQRGTFGSPDTCFGETVLTGDALVSSCQVMPAACKNHLGNQECGTYRHCDVDLCVVQRVNCTLRDPCDLEGFCAPTDGSCYYTKRPDGDLCDDGVDYTWGDTCFNGICNGIEDLCARHNVDCTTTNPCLQPQMREMWFGPSNCDTATGACMFQPAPDGQACTTDLGAGTCQDGLCRRLITDLCHGVTCPAGDQCNEAGICDYRTGACRVRFKAEGTPCDDGNRLTFRDRCVEGTCVGDHIETPLYQELGRGGCAASRHLIHNLCIGQEGLQQCGTGESEPPVMRYYSYAWDRQYCESQCTADPLCKAYDFGYQVCSIYGGHRTMDPNPFFWGAPWILETSPIVVAHDVECYEKRAGNVNNIPPHMGGTFFAASVALILFLPSAWTVFKNWGAFKQAVATVFYEGPDPTEDWGTWEDDDDEDSFQDPKGLPVLGDSAWDAPPQLQSEAEVPALEGNDGGDDDLALSSEAQMPAEGLRDPRGEVEVE